jgi:hypothetical protein
MRAECGADGLHCQTQLMILRGHRRSWHLQRLSRSAACEAWLSLPRSCQCQTGKSRFAILQIIDTSSYQDASIV